MPNLFSSVHVGEHAVFLGDNKLLMPPTMWSSVTVSDDSAKGKIELAPLFCCEYDPSLFPGLLL